MEKLCPKVSVIIPTFNRAQLVSRAIDSVLDQTFRDFEVIVVDDGSTDNTREAVSAYANKIIYIFQENRGISAARNQGIKASRGKYIAFLDSDDYWVPQKLADQVNILDAHEHTGLVFSRMKIFNEEGKFIGMKPQKETCRNFTELLMKRCDIPTSTVMTRRDIFSKTGLFDENLTIGEDTEMWLRIAKVTGLFEIQDRILANYARHSQQSTSDRIKVYQGQIKTELKILKTHSEASEDIIVKKIAVNEYMTGKTYYQRGQYRQAFAHVYKAFKWYWPLGELFYLPDDGYFKRLLKLIKPWGLLGASLFRQVFAH